MLVFPTVDGKVVAGPDRATTRRTRATGAFGPRPPSEMLPKAAAMLPPLEGAEPIASYAGLRPAGRGVNYVIGASRACAGSSTSPRSARPGSPPRSGSPSACRELVAGLGVELGDRSCPLEPGRPPRHDGPWWRRTAEYRVVGSEPAARRRRGHLGREGGRCTTPTCGRWREARREKPLAHPRPGWVEQDAEEVLDAVVGRGRRAARRIARRGGGVRARPPGRVGARLGRRERRPLTPIVTWQDKRSQEVLDRLEADGRAEQVRERSGMPLDPYFSAGKLAWLLENDAAVAAARDAGTLRLGTVDALLCDRLGAGFATDPSTASRTQLRPAAGMGPDSLLEIFGVPREALPAIARHRRRPRRAAPRPLAGRAPARARCVDQQAALAGAGCVEPGRVKATYGTGVFVLAHAGDRAPGAGGGLLPDRRLARRRSRRVRARRRRVHGRGAARVAVAATSASRPTRRRSPRWRREVEDAGGVRVLPRSPGVGAPWWRSEARAVIAGLTSGSRPAPRRPRRARGDRLARGRRARGGPRDRPVEVLRVDGGLTRDPLLLQLQADAAGVPVQRGAVDATAAGAAALAAVGAGIWGSTAEIAERVPAGEPTEAAPRRRLARARARGVAAVRRACERALVRASHTASRQQPARMCSVPSM